MNLADLAIAALAEQQFGVFSRHQAAVEGLSEAAMTRRVMTQRWAEVFPAVYRLPGATPYRPAACDGRRPMGRE